MSREIPRDLTRRMDFVPLTTSCDSPPETTTPEEAWGRTKLIHEYREAKHSSEQRRRLIEALNPIRTALATAESRIAGLERAVNREKQRADRAEAKLKSLGIDA